MNDSHFRVIKFKALNGFHSLPRGAGRARLLRPDLLTAHDVEISSTRTSTPHNSDSASVRSDQSIDSNASEFKELKRGTTGKQHS